MLKETGYQEKFEILRPWFADIVETVKKDLKNEHLKIDKEFCRRYFLGKSFMHVPLHEMADAYYRDIHDGNVGLGEFIATRWLLKNTDIYGYFEKILKTLSDDFDELEELPEEIALPLLKGAVDEFGATTTYLFSVLNSVVFPKALYEKLRREAADETEKAREEAEAQQVVESIEAMQKRHSREITAMSDRYEKKLSGLQRKYLRDMEILKKQVSRLQKKLSS
ncbi:MAG: hypothetical protein JJU12_07505 [Chlamydiales bacterium]|nr:hypothetical protein [Chlamydiales bacterium]